MHRRIRSIAMFAIATLVASACSNAKTIDTGVVTTQPPGVTTTTADISQNVPVDEKGVSDTEIKFTSIATGKNNILGTNIRDAYNDGIKAYFAYRNASGGIYGRDLVLAKTRDDELVFNQREAKAMIAEDDSFGAFVAVLQFPGAVDLAKAGVPTYGWGIHQDFADHPSMYGHLGALCLGCIGRTSPYIAKTIGAKVVGILGYNVANSSVCAEGLRDSFNKFEPELGIKVGLFDVGEGFGLPNGLAAQVTKMKAAKVDFVTACMDLNGMKTLGDELKKQGLDDVVLYHPNTYNQEFVNEAGGIFEGDYIAPQFVPYENKLDTEMQNKFFEYTDKAGVVREELTMIGWIDADMAYTGLLKAGPKFSRQSVIDGLNRVTNYNAGGLVATIDWTKQHSDPKADPTKRGAFECFSPVKVTNGKFVPAFTVDKKPWTCWSNASSEWSEPTQMAFSDSTSG